MGGSSSKKPFTKWDLVQFSNMTGVPLSMVEKIYKDFVNATENNNRMDKKEFRRLYKEMYMSGQTGNNPAPFITDHDLDKMSDHVFELYDFDGTGKLTFEEFAELYLMLSHYGGILPNGVTRRDRFNYILDQYDEPSPVFITRERGEQIFNRLNKYNNWSNWNNTAPVDSSKSGSTNWEYHWNKLDDGTGRVPKDKFVEYVTNLNDYKHHFNSTSV